MRRLALALALVLAAGPLAAVEPGEMLADPALESRAQDLDAVLRCVQCRSENIASSNADWARQARLHVRELVEGGASDAEVKAWFVARYGEFVLFTPPRDGANLILWVAGPAMLLVGAGIAAATLRGRGRVSEPAVLSEEEQARLDRLMRPDA